MIYFLTILVLYFAFIMVNAWVRMKQDKQDEAIAYHFWVDSLHKAGFPRKESGAMMDAWDLYAYWKENINKKPWLKHAKG